MADDDLAALFGPEPAGPSQDVRFRQGTVVTFDPVTLQNTVLVGGTVMVDLPLLGVGESTLLVPGAVVGVLAVGDASKTMYITGRIVTPNTQQAFDAIALLSSQTIVDYATSNLSISSMAYVAGDGGPEVTVTVRRTGRVLALWAAQLDYDTLVGANPAGGGAMSLIVSGANTRAASNDWSLVSSHVPFVSTGTVADVVIFRAATAYLFEGLNAGPTTFTAAYRAVWPDGPCGFSDRTLAVIVL